MSKNPENDHSVVLRLLGLFKPYKGSLIFAFFGTLFFGLVNSAVALILAAMMELFAGVSSAGAAGDTSGMQIHLHRSLGGWDVYDIMLNNVEEARYILLLMALGTLALILIKDFVFFVKEYVMWKVTNGTLMTLKSSMFERIVRLPLRFYDRQRSGDLIARMTYDVTQLEGAIRAGLNVSKSMLYTVIYVIGMFILDWSLTLVALAIFPLSAVLIKYFGGRIRRAARNLSENVADYTAYLSETTSGARAIKAFGQEEEQTRSFRLKLKENYHWAMKAAKYATINSPAQEAISSIGTAALVVYCGLRMISGMMTIGDLTGFLVLLSNAYKPIKDLGEITGTVQRAVASGRRIFDLLDESDEIKLIGSGTKTPAAKGCIEFNDVKFGYAENELVLHGIDLTIEAGKTFALVGPSGGGKSTIISLIPRFYPLQQGLITLDGLDTSEFDLKYLRSLMAYVPQETILFSGTIEDNIRFGKLDASFDEITAAAKAANVDNFVSELSDGYKSEVGERGVQLSGGQRQRLSIARAILRDPRILLLDEATSSLDTESERLVQDALERLRQDRTTVMIAHRLSTVQNADKIAVIDKGRIVELGSHKELFSASGIYRKLCDQQLNMG
ncbi:ABC transporter ATP-binding protein/permease [bacterium]|nr:ABC transporter ATP-binding protein/permease [bacterium]